MQLTTKTKNVIFITMKKVGSLLCLSHCIFGKICLNLQTFAVADHGVKKINIPKMEPPEHDKLSEKEKRRTHRDRVGKRLLLDQCSAPICAW
jgi:hypothetical protein